MSEAALVERCRPLIKKYNNRVEKAYEKILQIAVFANKIAPECPAPPAKFKSKCTDRGRYFIRNVNITHSHAELLVMMQDAIKWAEAVESLRDLWIKNYSDITSEDAQAKEALIKFLDEQTSEEVQKS